MQHSLQVLLAREMLVSDSQVLFFLQSMSFRISWRIMQNDSQGMHLQQANAFIQNYL